MTRLLLITLLLLSSAPAYAEWVEVAEGGKFTTYADPETIRGKGSFVKMWVLYNSKTIQTNQAGKSFLSLKAQNEYDCAEEQYRQLAEYLYSGSMGDGEMVYSNTDLAKWSPVMPSSLSQANLKFACKKR